MCNEYLFDSFCGSEFNRSSQCPKRHPKGNRVLFGMQIISPVLYRDLTLTQPRQTCLFCLVYYVKPILHGLFSLTTACDTAKVKITLRIVAIAPLNGLSPVWCVYKQLFSWISKVVFVPVGQTLLPDSMGSTQMRCIALGLVTCQGVFSPPVF